MPEARYSKLARVLLAGFHALTASVGAVLAVVVLVLAALIGTLLADFEALFNNVLGVL